MKLEDWMIYSEDFGKQINIMLILGVISSIFYFLTVKILPLSCLREVLKGVFLFEAAVYYGCTLILFKKWTERIYS